MASRWKEPSTYAGVGLIVTGLGQVASINEAPAIAGAIEAAAPHIATSNWVGVAMALFGAFAVMLREKGERR